MKRNTLPLVVVAVLAWTSPTHAAPEQDPELAKQQVDYAKQMYSEGLKALERKDFPTAVVRFEEAYRYAPDKPAFNFNIAEAAYAAGDCTKARTHYQRFLDLVPDHPEHDSAVAQLAKIEKSGCAGAPEPAPAKEEEEAAPLGPASDEESPELGGVKLSKEQKKERELLRAALSELRIAEALMDKILAKHGKQSPFPSVGRHEHRDERKLKDLMRALDHSVPEPPKTPPSLPDTTDKKDACEKAKEQLGDYARALKIAHEHFNAGKANRMLRSLERKAQKNVDRLTACK